MRRNNFTSASDRRWQRRYERIQQRREEELERRDRQGREEAYEAMKFHDIGIDSLIASSPTFTVEIQRPDEPNLNGTVISEEAWDAAWTRYLQRAADAGRRSLSEEIVSYLATDEANSEERSRLWHRIRDLFYKEISDAYEARRAEAEIHERTAQAQRGYRAQNMVVDDYSGVNIRFANGGYIIIDDLAPFEPEPELKAGDSAELDSFLGNFLAPGA